MSIWGNFTHAEQRTKQYNSKIRQWRKDRLPQVVFVGISTIMVGTAVAFKPMKPTVGMEKNREFSVKVALFFDRFRYNSLPEKCWKITILRGII
jgi:hypothetical protein